MDYLYFFRNGSFQRAEVFALHSVHQDPFFKLSKSTDQQFFGLLTLRGDIPHTVLSVRRAPQKWCFWLLYGTRLPPVQRGARLRMDCTADLLLVFVWDKTAGSKLKNIHSIPFPMLLLTVPEAVLSHTKTRSRSAVQSIFCVAPWCPRGRLVPYKSEENQFHPVLASLGTGAPMHHPPPIRQARQNTKSLIESFAEIYQPLLKLSNELFKKR